MSMSIATMKGRLTSPEMQLHFLRWFDSAPIYSGSITANRLGWQVVRTKAKNYAISVRRAVQRDHADHALASVLDRDGIVVIPDFLNPDDFQRVRAACDEYAHSPRVRDIGSENGAGIRFLNGPVLSDRPGDSASVINDALASDPRTIALAEHVIGRRVKGPLRVIFQFLETGGVPDDADREQILHADKAYPCAKAIYTLDDITEDCGPFVYAKGSHRISNDRLRYERTMGIREAYLRRGRLRDTEQDEVIQVERSRHVMTETTKRSLGVVETPMTCPANSMIITNNAGFHRRGRLAEGSALPHALGELLPVPAPLVRTHRLPIGEVGHRHGQRVTRTSRGEHPGRLLTTCDPARRSSDHAVRGRQASGQ